ncbi:hypothetical protein C6497_06295 [Candidatus Poribacteria bacterium]|nr:MAG: hypothetical protein C6497_06295 [Candidatus Poribacteria bacterium]
MKKENTELTNDDLRALFEPMFNTGKPQHRDDLRDAVLEKYPNLSPYYFELVGNEKHKTRLYGKIDNVIGWYKRNKKIYNVEKGSGLWQSTSNTTSNQ